MKSTLFNNIWPTTPSGYKPTSPLGYGTFGLVWKYEVTQGPRIGSLVAIKRIRLEECNDMKLDEITVELT